MRQVFFLLASAMFVAFSLSWASPSLSTDSYYAMPDHVIFPASFSFGEKPEISASVTLKDSCESIESIEQESRGHKVIFSIRLQHKNNDLCLQQERSNVPVSIAIENFKVDSSGRIDVYFREDDENLKYFGAIEMKENLLSKN